MSRRRRTLVLAALVPAALLAVALLVSLDARSDAEVPVPACFLAEHNGWAPPVSGSADEMSLPPPPPAIEIRGPSGRSILPLAGAPVKKSWTLLFYDDADFRMAYDPLYHFAEYAFSGEHLHIVVLRDGRHDPSDLYYVNADHSLHWLGSWGEVNMADPATLREFIRYGKERFPAERYLLALYDHGGGWAGACVDDTDGGWLEMDDIRQALVSSGGVDIIAFTAPCLMGALESVYELRDVADVYIGSEELSGYVVWFGVMDDISGLLNDPSSRTTVEIGRRIVEAIDEDTTFPQYRHDLTISAVRTDKLVGFVEAMHALSAELRRNVSASAYALYVARLRSKVFGLHLSDWMGAIDAYDFLHELERVETNPAILEQVHRAMDAFHDSVIGECHGRNQYGAHGLSIYFPRREMYYLPEYENCLLDFPAHTDWEEFLADYYEQVAP